MRMRILAISGLLGYARLIRPRLNSLGASEEERQASYPGDELIADAHTTSTMATTLAAPPAEVWAWLVQMGCDRAGFYSWDRLDNGGRSSANRIHPEWQHVRQGDRIASSPNGSLWFDVGLLKPEQALVLRASMTFPVPRWFDPAGPLPSAFSDSTWGFFLTPLDGGRTRLVVRCKARGEPGPIVRMVNWAFWEPAHGLMQTRQFAGLRRRLERPASPSHENLVDREHHELYAIRRAERRMAREATEMEHELAGLRKSERRVEQSIEEEWRREHWGHEVEPPPRWRRRR
jgi:proline iminopeptidase